MRIWPSAFLCSILVGLPSPRSEPAVQGIPESLDPTPEEQREIASLLAPTEDDLARRLAAVEVMIARDRERSRAAAAIYASKQPRAERLHSILEELGDGDVERPRLYATATYGASFHDDTEGLAILAVELGSFDTETLERLLDAARAVEFASSSDFEARSRRARRARAAMHGFVALGGFERAGTCVADLLADHHGADVLLSAIADFEREPTFDHRVAVVRCAHELLTGDLFTLSSLRAAFGLYRDAKSDHDRASALSLAVEIESPAADSEISREITGPILEAVACLLAAESNSPQRESALQHLASFAHHDGKKRVAFALWTESGRGTPGSTSWAISTFNRGITLKDARCHSEAVAMFQTLIDAPVNDLDRGGNIMEIFRNYRNRAAREIAKCEERRGDVKAALRWLESARDTYKYRSSCGNCSAGARKSLDAEIDRVRVLAEGK